MKLTAELTLVLHVEDPIFCTRLWISVTLNTFLTTIAVLTLKAKDNMKDYSWNCVWSSVSIC